MRTLLLSTICVHVKCDLFLTDMDQTMLSVCLLPNEFDVSPL